MIRSEILKLKRSYTWIICIIIPILSVGFGSLNFFHNQDQLDNNWQSLSAQTGLFYALIFFNMGAAIIISTIWRDDIKKNNWMTLQTCYKQPRTVFFIKSLVGAALIVSMHIFFTLLTLGVGLFMGVPDIDISQLALNFLLVAVVVLPLTIFQSLLSYLTRSFAWPIGICLVLCVAGFAVVSSEAAFILKDAIPQALTTYAIAAPSSAFSIGSNFATDLASCIVIALLQSLVFMGATIFLYSRRLRTA